MLKFGLGTRMAVAALAVVPVLAAACGTGTASAGPGATVPQAESTSTTSADPYAIPSPITPAYVQGVLNELEAINNQAMEIIITQKSLVPDAARLIRAVNTSSSFNQQTMIVLNQLASGLTNYRDPPGAVKDAVVRVVSGDPSCIFATLTRDYSALEKDPAPSPLTYVVLRPLGPSDDPMHLNPTPWVIDFLGYDKSGSPIADSCLPH